MSSQNKSYGMYALVVILLIFGIGFGIWLFLIAIGEVDNPLSDDDTGYAGSDISEKDWFGGTGADWTEYANPNDTTVSVELPFDDFVIEDSTYVASVNGSNVTDFGGYDATWGQINTDDDDSDGLDEARGFICVYGNLENTTYDEDDLMAIIQALIDLGSGWEPYEDSPINMTIDSHGGYDVTVEKGLDTSTNSLGMIFYVTYDCEDSGRTYALLYGVAKDLDFNEWDDRCAILECRTVFESFICHS